MEVPFLTSLMGTITVVATYYWVGRPDEAVVEKKEDWHESLVPIPSSPPYWSNEWI